MKKVSIVSFVFVLISLSAFTQEIIHIDIQKAQAIAQGKSIRSNGAKSSFRSSLWQFKSFKAEFLPSLTLKATPLSFNRSISQRYNFVTNQDEFREIQNIENYLGFSLRQNIGILGGTIYMDSNLDRLQTFTGEGNISYSSTPIRVGYSQKLFGFNKFKWMKKQEPLKYELAQKKYTETVEQISEEVVRLFFELAISKSSLELSKTKLNNIDTLHILEQRKLKIGSASINDVKHLELNKINANIEVQKEVRNVKRASLKLSSYLRIDENTKYVLSLPEKLLDIHINDEEIKNILVNNHPKTLALKLKELNTERSLAEAKASRWGSSNLNLSYGLNQSANNLSDAFINPLDQQKLRITLEMPILDWGLSKGKYKIALSNRDETLSQIKQERIDYEEELRVQLIEFQLQRNMVLSAKKAKELGKDVYKTATNQYLNGNINLSKLNDVAYSWEKAEKNYINALKEYWTKYYTLKRLTLFDFETKTQINHSIEKLKF